MSDKHAPCPKCSGKASRHSYHNRKAVMINGRVSFRVPLYNCKSCNVYFTVNPPGYKRSTKYHDDVVNRAVGLVRSGYTLARASEAMEKIRGVRIPMSTINMLTGKIRKGGE